MSKASDLNGIVKVASEIVNQRRSKVDADLTVISHMMSQMGKDVKPVTRADLARLDHQNGVGLFYVVDGLPVGTTQVSMVPSIGYFRRTAVIGDTVTHGDFLQRGINRVLMNEAFAEAQRREATDLMLVSNPLNPEREVAIGIYKDLGFVELPSRLFHRKL